MWNEMAQALGLKLPADQVERIAPVLDAMWKATRQVLDRDLSATEPAIVFRAETGGVQ
jgi:hypothetical protein